MSKPPGSIFLKCFSPGAEGAQKLSLGHPKWSRNGSRMVDMRNQDTEMDRTGPTDHFRPFQTPQTSQKRQQTPESAKWDQKIEEKKIPLSIPLWGALLVLP